MPECPQCGEGMRIEYKESKSPLRWVKIEECAKHGRIFSSVYPAASVEAVKELCLSAAKGLVCDFCKKEVPKLILDSVLGLACAECIKSAIKESPEQAAINSHLREIMSE